MKKYDYPCIYSFGKYLAPIPGLLRYKWIEETTDGTNFISRESFTAPLQMNQADVKHIFSVVR